MADEKIATDDVVEENNNPDVAETDSEVTENTDEETVVDETVEASPDETTGSPKPDELTKASAKVAFEYREERRKREAVEAKLADMEAYKAAPTQDKPVMPKLGEFETDEAYNEAVGKYHEDITDWKFTQREAMADRKKKTDEFFKSNQKAYDRFLGKADEAAEKYPDFHKKIQAVDFTDVAREAIYKSENSAEISIHIANNPALAEKLRTLSPVDTVLEIKNLDLELTQSLKQKTVSTAPEPITPVDGNAGVIKNLSDIKSDDEWFKERKRLKKVQLAKQ